MFFPVSVFANENNYVGCDLIGVEESKFENLIEEIQNIETTHPEYTEEMIKNVLDERHQRYKKKIENLILWNWYIKKHTSAKKRQC